MREFSALGLADELLAAGIENRESCFFNRFGQLIYKEPRGKFAGYEYPEVGIHRGRLHMILYDGGAQAARSRTPSSPATIAPASSRTKPASASSSAAVDAVRADVAIACDGINSAIRRQFYPDEKVAFAGINTWRGVTRRKPILGGRTYMRVGSILTGKIVIYPIIDNVDADGNQLINWMAEIKRDSYEQNDWNKPGNLADFFPLYESWRFDWLDVAQMIRDAEQILEYPMVDKDPIARWSFGRVTLAGDAAHPMYPRGSNGAAQSAIDARVLADCLRSSADPRDALNGLRGARGWNPPARSCAPTASTRRISSISRSSNWSATSRSTTSTNTSPRTNYGRCRRAISASPVLLWPMWRPGAAVKHKLIQLVSCRARGFSPVSPLSRQHRIQAAGPLIG